MLSGSNPEWGMTVDWSTGQRVPAPARRQSTWSAPPEPGILPKRLMGFFEVLDAGFRLLRRFPSLTFGSAAIGVGLAAGVMALAAATVWYFANSFFGRLLENSEDAVAGLSFVVQAGMSIVELVTLATLIFFSGLASAGARQAFFGHTVTLRQAWRTLKGCRRQLLIATLALGTVHCVILAVFLAGAVLAGVYGGAIVGLSVGAVAVVIWWLLTLFFSIRLSLLGCVIVQERLDIGAAMKRSWQLTGRSFFAYTGQSVFGFWLSGQIISIMTTPIFLYVGMIGGIIIGLLLAGSDVESPVFFAVVGSVFTAVFVASIALLYAYRAGFLSALYFNQRIRTEGYDLVLLSEAEKP